MRDILHGYHQGRAEHGSKFSEHIIKTEKFGRTLGRDQPAKMDRLSAWIPPREVAAKNASTKNINA